MFDPKAGFLRRFLALFIDIMLLDILNTAVTWPLQVKFNLTLDDIVEPFLLGTPVSRSVAAFLGFHLLFTLLLWGFYFTFFIGGSGQTPGKKLLGLRVKRIDGQPLDHSVAFQRWLGYYLSAVPGCLGFFWALVDPEGRTWHDKLAGTTVVKAFPNN